MGFWGTAAAAFVGGIGVLLLGGLCRYAWLLYKIHFTAYGRLQTRIGIQAEQAAKDLEGDMGLRSRSKTGSTDFSNSDG